MLYEGISFSSNTLGVFVFQFYRPSHIGGVPSPQAAMLRDPETAHVISPVVAAAVCMFPALR